VRARHIDVEELAAAEAFLAYLVVGRGQIADVLESDNYLPGTAGIMLDFANGTAEFGAAAIRGQLQASQIRIDDAILDTDGEGNLTVRQSGVTRDLLAPNATVRINAAERAYMGLTHNEPTWRDCMTTTLTMVGGRGLLLQVSGDVDAQSDPGGDPQFEWRILVNGTQIWKSAGSARSMNKTIKRTSVAGTDVPITVQVDTNGTGGFVNLYDMSLVATEFIQSIQ
jgi:hypothetical protein